MAAAMTGVDSSAQINSPTAAGYMARGVAMYNDKNYEGCLDQLLQVRNLDPATAQQEEALYYVAMATLYCGDDEALDLLNNFMRRYPQSYRYSDVVVATGDFHFTRGNYADAIKAYNSVNADALTEDRCEDMLYRKAYSLMLLGDNNKAAEIFKKLMNVSGYSNAATFYMGYIEYANHNYDQAMSYFRKVDTSCEPGSSADYYISQICFMEKDYSQAFQTASKLLNGKCAAQFRPEMNRVAGESLYNLGDEQAALPYLREYMAETTDVLPSTYYIIGVSEFKSGNYADAIEMLRHATEMPNAMGQSASLYLGLCYVKTDKTDGALMAFEKAYRENYDKHVVEEAFYNYIVARSEGGRVPFGKSVSMMEEFLKQYPRSRYADDIRQSLITGFMSDNDYESALRILSGVNNPSERMIAAKQRVLFMIGTRDFQSGRLQQSINNLQQASEIDNGNSSIRYQSLLWLGNAQFEADLLEEAAESYLSYLTEAPAADANRQLAYYNLGYTRFRQSRWDDAIKDFRRVADARSVNSSMKADALNRLADCLYYKERPGEAATVYSQAYKANPQAGDYALYQAALMKGRQGDNAALIDAMDNMMNRFPNSALVPAAMLEKAQAFVAIGSTKDAIDTYKELATNFPSTSQGRNAYLQLAVTQLNAGNTSAAIEAYKDVVRTYPTSEEAQTAIADLRKLYAEESRLNEFADFVNSVPNAPKIDASTLDAAAFQAAETEYIDTQHTGKLTDYLRDYPQGTYEAQALYYIAEAASNDGDGQTALDYVSAILTEYPDADVAEDALLLKGDNELNQGKAEVALSTYMELERRASTPRILNEARMGMMRASMDLRRYDEVLSITDKIASTSAPGTTDMEEVSFTRAEVFDAKGNHNDAYEIWSELATSPNSLYGAKSAVYMAQSLLDNGKTDRAFKTADNFINAGTTHNYWFARAFIVLSDALREQGNVYEADEYLKNLKNNYPDSDEDIFLMINERLNR